jgi:hypothetical protein
MMDFPMEKETLNRSHYLVSFVIFCGCPSRISAQGSLKNFLLSLDPNCRAVEENGRTRMRSTRRFGGGQQCRALYRMHVSYETILDCEDGDAACFLGVSRTALACRTRRDWFLSRDSAVVPSSGERPLSWTGEPVAGNVVFSRHIHAKVSPFQRVTSSARFHLWS